MNSTHSSSLQNLAFLPHHHVCGDQTTQGVENERFLSRREKILNICLFVRYYFASSAETFRAVLQCSVEKLSLLTTQ